jgi:hypothetical protein
LVPNSFPPVEALEFGTSPILVSLLCDLKRTMPSSAPLCLFEYS